MSSIVIDQLKEVLPAILQSRAYESLNPPAARENCRDLRRMLSLLRMNGIPTIATVSSDRDRADIDYHQFIKRYYVYLFQHKVICMLQADQPAVWLNQQINGQQELSFQEVTELLEEKEFAALSHLAIRCLYALGLDYGMVHIGAGANKRVKVIDVLPVPKLTESLDQKYEHAVLEYEQERKSDRMLTKKAVLGADPEFALRDAAGNMVVASRFLPREGLIGCDSARVRTETAVSHQLPLAEIRPEPSAYPEHIILSIYQGMQLGMQKITDHSLEWIAGGMPFPHYPIGGHIHFSGIPLSFELLHALDTYVCLPLTLIEDEGCQSRRPRYGFLGDFREKPHGGFEYRTLPSWLVTPGIAFGVLILAKLVAENHTLLKQHQVMNLRVRKAYYQGDTAALEPFVRGLHQELTRLSAYETYKKELDGFFAVLFSGKKWPANSDIRRAWKLLT